jgi:hypothetical protein
MEEYNIRIMCGDRPIAIARKGEDGVFVFDLQPDVPEWLIPKFLFPKDSKVTTFKRVREWAERRVFDKNRTDKKELLEGMGMKSYVPWEIAKVTRASLVHDYYWIAFYYDDEYETECARGRMGAKPIEW